MSKQLPKQSEPRFGLPVAGSIATGAVWSLAVVLWWDPFSGLFLLAAAVVVGAPLSFFSTSFAHQHGASSGYLFVLSIAVSSAVMLTLSGMVVVRLIGMSADV